MCGESDAWRKVFRFRISRAMLKVERSELLEMMSTTDLSMMGTGESMRWRSPFSITQASASVTLDPLMKQSCENKKIKK